MGRPKTTNAKPPVAKPSARKAGPTAKPAKKLTPLPPRRDIAGLAKVRNDVSEKLLQNRLRSFTSMERAEFAEACKISVRQVQRIAKANTRTPHTEESMAKAKELWLEMIDTEGHKATFEKLKEELEDDWEISVPLGTLGRWMFYLKKPWAPAYQHRSNRPDIHHKLVSMRGN